MGRRRWGRIAPLVACLLAGSVLVADAAVAPIDQGAGGALAPAVPLSRPPTDAVSITQTPVLTEAVISASMAAADEAGAAAVLGGGLQIGLMAVYRNGAPVLLPRAPGWRFPVGVSSLPPSAISATMGRALAAQIGGTSVVMSASSATMHGGVQAGDILEVQANDGNARQFLVAQVVADEVIGGTEVLMTVDQTLALGSPPTRVYIYGPRDRAALDAGLAARGVGSYAGQVRVRRTWDPPDPDSTISLLQTKRLLGEPQYQMIPGSDNVNLDPAWVAANIPQTGGRLNGYVRNNCHIRISADLQAALNDVDAAGLTAALRGPDAIANVGGCFNPRFNRNTPSDFVGSLSRHTWAQAMDINTIANCQGCVPQMNCAIVRIFRAHNFAWGGNFPRTDGMHFEWVGERRDLRQYPSRYCPNAPLAGTSTDGTPPMVTEAGMSELFVDDGWGTH